MISPETVVFDGLYNELIEKYPDATITGSYNPTPATFPCVTIEESDNYVFERMSTVKRENAAKLNYEVNVYTNVTGTKKSQAKAIMAVVDDYMAEHGFTRTMCEPIPNLADSTIYRLTAEYTAVATKQVSGDETTYVIYSE